MFVILEWVHRLDPTLRPGQKGRCFAHDIHKCIFLDESISSLIQISLKFIQSNDKPVFVQIKAWRRSGDKSSYELMMAEFAEACMGHSAMII